MACDGLLWFYGYCGLDSAIGMRLNALIFSSNNVLGCMQDERDHGIMSKSKARHQPRKAMIR